MGSIQVQKQRNCAWDHTDHHSEDRDLVLGKEGGARVEMSPTGWKVMARWDKHNQGIKHLCFIKL